jgi:signal transduction histidine kinase
MMQQDRERRTEVLPSTGSSENQGRRSLRVLVVVDKPVEATLVRFMLAESKDPRFTFKWATTLAGATGVLRQGGIDLVLTDLFLPDSLGQATFRAIAEVAPAVPIVLLIRQEDELLGISAVRNGAQDYLIKGQIGTSLLLKTVRQAIQRKSLELEHHNMQEHLRRAEKSESLSMLAGGVAHDFSNLLAAILGNSEIALRRLAKDHPARKHVESVIQSSLQATELTEKMLAYTGNSSFRLGKTDLAEVIRDVRNRLGASFDAQAIQLELNENLPELVCDMERIRDLVTHLLVNALESVADTGGTVTVRADRDAPADQVLLEVIDTGCGMDAETLRRAFDPFFTTKFTGRGLGLSAAMGIVRGHQGEIRIDSTLGSGTTVHVSLPIRRDLIDVDRIGPVELPAEIRMQEAPGLDPALQSGPGVLVIDDEQPLRELAEDILTECSCHVYLAPDGEQGLRVLQENLKQIRLVILDVVLPGQTGREIFTQIEQIAPKIPILLASGYDAKVAEDLQQSPSFAGFLQKPFTIDNMVSVVDEALDRTGSSGGSYAAQGFEGSIESQFRFDGDDQVGLIDAPGSEGNLIG